MCFLQLKYFLAECCLNFCFCTFAVQFIKTDLAEAIDASILQAIGGYMSMDMLIKGVYAYRNIDLGLDIGIG